MRAPLRLAKVLADVQDEDWWLVVPLVRVPVLLDGDRIGDALRVYKSCNLGLGHVRPHEVTMEKFMFFGVVICQCAAKVAPL